MNWFRSLMRRAATEAVEDVIESPFGPLSRYNGTFSVLTITFAEGSDPQAVSIPYRPFDNRTDVALPFRVVKVEQS